MKDCYYVVVKYVDGVYSAVMSICKVKETAELLVERFKYYDKEFDDICAAMYGSLHVFDYKIEECDFIYE